MPTTAMTSAADLATNSRPRNNVIYVVCEYAGDRAEQCAVPGRRYTYVAEKEDETESEDEAGGGRGSHERVTHVRWALSSRSHPPTRGE